jgi:pyruvate dehydrogenase E2 component (dihydrolipoamide acetyltransferase)
MLQKILMPKLGLTMTEGQIVEWLVAVGSPFKAEDGLFVVETEKVATEIPAEADGVLAEITVEPGQAVNVGDVVGYWQAAGDAPDQILAGVKKAVVGAVPPPMSLAPVAELVASVTPAPADGTRVPVTPLARRLAQQLDVSLANIAGSGPGRRIKAADVQAAAAVIAAAARPLAVAASAPLEQASRSTPTSVQATIARRLAAAKQQVPHFYLAVDAQVSRLLKLRADLNAMDGMARLTLNHFIVAAVGRALLDLPDANRVWSDDAILSFSGTDVGVAVTTERGLFVPVVRDAGRVPLMEVARRTRAQVEQARNGRLTANDMSGGAITVSNAGMFNVKYMTSIINPGQAMILGVGSISQAFRPDADGRPELRDEMGLVLACDHRILDGVSGLKFLNCVVAYLEQPMKLLLNA